MVDTIEETQTTKGGLMLGQEDKKHFGVEKGKVVSIGPLCSDALQEGDTIIYDANMCNAVDVDGELFKVIREDLIILVQRG